MAENTDLIAKRAAYAAVEAAITLHIERAEKLAVEGRALQAEIAELEQDKTVVAS